MAVVFQLTDHCRRWTDWHHPWEPPIGTTGKEEWVLQWLVRWVDRTDESWCQFCSPPEHHRAWTYCHFWVHAMDDSSNFSWLLFPLHLQKDLWQAPDQAVANFLHKDWSQTGSAGWHPRAAELDIQRLPPSSLLSWWSWMHQWTGPCISAGEHDDRYTMYVHGSWHSLGLAGVQSPGPLILPLQ